MKKVDIDLSSGLSIDSGAFKPNPRALGTVGKMPPPLEMEKSRSFRLSQSVAETPMEAPVEESEVCMM